MVPSAVAALLVGFSALLVGQASGQQSSHSYKPPNGFVPDSVTAVRIAEAVLVPVYGQRVVDNEKPLRAALVKGIWTVRGTLRTGPGGVAHIEIAKSDGRILRMTHAT